MPLINFHPPILLFRVFNLGIPFIVKPSFSSFQLDLSFSFFVSSLWFKLPFQIFTLNPFSFFSSCQNCLFGFSTLTSLSFYGLKHNTSWLYQHWWNQGTFSHPFRQVSKLLLRMPFSPRKVIPSWVTVFHGDLVYFGGSVWALVLLLETVWVRSSYHEPLSFSFGIAGHDK